MNTLEIARTKARVQYPKARGQPARRDGKTPQSGTAARQRAKHEGPTGGGACRTGQGPRRRVTASRPNNNDGAAPARRPRRKTGTLVAERGATAEHARLRTRRVARPRHAGRGEIRREEVLNTIAAKESKAGTLIGELERLDMSEELDDLEMRRLAREARSLMASDATGAHAVLGGIAGVEGDAAKVHEHYRAALQLSNRHSVVLGNYATALGRAGEFDEAFPTIMEAHRRAPDDARLLSNAIILAIEGGRFTESVPLYDAWNRLQPKRRHDYESAARKAADAAKRRKFTEAAVRKVVRLAHGVRVAAKVRHAASTLRGVFGEPDRFSLSVYVRSTPRRAVELGNEFVEQVVADESLMSDPGLMVTVMFKGTTIDGSDSRAAP